MTTNQQCAQGALSTLFVSRAGTAIRNFSTALDIERWDFLSESMRDRAKIEANMGITGTLEQIGERTSETAHPVDGVLVGNPSPLWFHHWMSSILGGDGTTVAGVTTFLPAVTLPDFDILLNKVNGIFQYSQCYVNRAIISGKSGRGENISPIQVALEIVAKLETEQLISFTLPAVNLPVGDDAAIYTFDSDTQLNLTIDGTPTDVEMKWFQLYIDNNITRRWVNNPNATSFCTGSRTIALRTGSAYTSANSGYRAKLKAGVPGYLQFRINADYYTKFAFPNLKAFIPTPVVQGKQEIDTDFPLVAYTLAAAPSVAVTNKKG